MSALNQQQVSVPSGTAYNTVAMLQSNEKVGKVSLRIHNHNRFNNQQQPVHGDTLLFNFYESDDGNTWGSALNASPVSVKCGAEETVNLLLRKRFVRIMGKGSTGVGGYARIDTQLAGRLFQGQLEFMVWGKSGYGYDGGPTHQVDGIQDMATTPWPEGAAA